MANDPPGTPLPHTRLLRPVVCRPVVRGMVSLRTVPLRTALLTAVAAAFLSAPPATASAQASAAAEARAASEAPPAATAEAPVGAATVSVQVPGDPPAPISDREFHDRRAALTAPDGDGLTVILGSAQNRGAHLSFQYLTGLTEVDAVLVVEREGARVRSTVYLDPAAPAPILADGSAPRWSDDGTEGPPRMRPLDALAADLEGAFDGLDALTFVGQGDPTELEGSPAARALRDVLAARTGGDAAGDGALEVRSGNARVTELRAVKSPAELELIRRAVAVTDEAHRALLRAIRPGITENDLKVVIDSVFQALGADERPAFGHIVASGPNSTILHYRGGDRALGEDEHVKIDIGAAVHGYAADVTRTYPVNGTFWPELAAIFQIVRDAQATAEAMAAEGAARNAMSQAANGVLSTGLAELGLIEAPDAVYDCPARGGPGTGTCAQLGLVYFHSLGHGIGLNVHDPTPPTTVPGSAFSIEPGIYVRPGHLETLPDTPRNRAMIEAVADAWARYDGIGVRIEDDYIMTEEGFEWISRSPREIADIEAAMAEGRRARGGG